MIIAVAVVIVLTARHYQKVRVDTGYNSGRYYKRGQHIGAYIGNYHMDEMGVGDKNSDYRTDSDEEMFLFSEKDKQ